MRRRLRAILGRVRARATLIFDRAYELYHAIKPLR